MALSSSPDIGNTDHVADQSTDYMPTFYIGHHESSRTQPVTGILLQQVHSVGYDMFTTPITTPHFQGRVLALVKTYLSELSLETYKDRPTQLPSLPIIPPLQPADTFLSPLESISQVIACSSSWIDLGSADPLISNISKQVLNMEISYASFCGIGHIIIPGPKSITLGSTVNDLLTQYARAIQEALTIGNFIQISIYIPMYISENSPKKMEIFLYTQGPNLPPKDPMTEVKIIFLNHGTHGI